MGQKKTVREPINSEIRREEFTAAQGLLDRYALNKIVILRGEVGSGKTGLLTRLAQYATRTMYTIVSPGAVLNTPQASSGHDSDVRQPRRRPLVVIDDVDAMDDALQQRLLERVCAPDACEPISMIATARSSSAFDRAAHIVDLGPLTPENTREILSVHGLSASTTIIDHLTDAASGNLALILQRVAESAQQPLTIPTLFATACAHLPSRYEYLAADYLALDASEQSALLTLAIERSLPARLRTESPRSENSDDAREHLLHTCRGFLVPDHVDSVRFASSLHQTAVMLSASNAQHADAHRALAARAGGDGLARTLHAAMVGSHKATELPAASRMLAELELTGWASAVRLRGIDDAAPEERQRSRSEAITAAVYDGDLDFARELSEQVSESAFSTDDSVVARAIKRTLAFGETVAASDMLHDALVDDDLAPARSNELLAALAVVCLVQSDDLWWASWLRAARRIDGIDATGVALTHEVCHALRGLADDVDVDVVVASDTAASPRAQGLFSAVAAIVRTQRKQRQGVRELGALSMTGRRSGLAGLLIAERIAELHVQNDEWAEAVAAANLVSEHAARGGVKMVELRARATGAVASALLGDVQAARSGAYAVLSDPLARRAPIVAAAAEHALAICYLSTGDAGSALTILGDQAPDGALTTGGPYEGFFLDLVDARLSTGQSRRSITLPDGPAGREFEYGSLRRQFVERCVRAALDEDDGALVELIADSRGTAFVFERARMRLMYGQRLREADRGRESTTHLQAAAADFEHLGAKRWRERAIEALRPVESGARVDDIRTIGTLTEQEERIAALAAAGLSNKEIGNRLFLSPRTVGGHLYNIFPKLGVSSRAALRDALQDYSFAEQETVATAS